MIDLAPEYLNIVRNILRQYVPDAQVWAFGSRVTWTAKEFSDLDLVIIHDELIPADNMVQIAEDLSESNLPIKIDILEWRSISEEFRKEITKQHYSIYKYRLGEIGNIVTGKTPITRFSHYFGKDIPFITPRDMDDTRYITETDRSLSIDGARSVKSAMIPKNSIVVSCIGSDMGKIAIAREKSVTNQQINSLIVNDENDFLYVYYSLCTKRHELRSIASGSALPILNKSDFEKIEIDLPSLETQKETAHILGTLDDKIELNRRMNNTLEEIAQALFKHWFIDFEFPNEEGKPYKSSGGEMINSELGPIPKDWRVGKIGDLCTLEYGQSLKKEDRIRGSTPVMGSNGQIGWHNEAIVRGPGIVIGRKGNPGIVTWIQSDFYPIDTTFYAIPRDRHEQLGLLYYVLKYGSLHKLDSDSAVPGLNREAALSMTCIIPSLNIAAIFEKTNAMIADSKFKNDSENANINKIKSILLKELI